MALRDPSSAGTAVAGDTRTAVLHAMRKADKPLTVAQIADEVGLHVNTIRFHLSRLIQARLVQEERTGPTGPGRPQMVYRPVSGTPDIQPQESYQFLAQILAGHLAATSPAPAAASIAAGEEWGRYLAERPVPFSKLSEEESVGQLVTLLRELGFDPERHDEDHRVLLRNCPFRAVSDRHPNVVCSVHLGLTRGLLAEIGAPVRVTDLERFEAPHPCVTHLESIAALVANDEKVSRPADPERRSAGTRRRRK